MAAIALVGTIAYRALPISDLPAVEYPSIQINTNLPGGDPVTMAASVASPLERQFTTIAGIDEMTSRSGTGSTNVTLTFDLEARVDRDRRYWVSSNIVDLTLRRELNYHAVSDRYVVKDTKSGDQLSFPTLDEALDYLGRVDAWPILVEPQLDGGNYTISVRAGVRRGHLPASLRAILFWTDDWARVSEWYSWSLPV